MQEELFLFLLAEGASGIHFFQFFLDFSFFSSIPAVLMINHVTNESQLYQVIYWGYNTTARNPKSVFKYSSSISLELDNKNYSFDIDC
jgi:hypothetical protein